MEENKNPADNQSSEAMAEKRRLLEERRAAYYAQIEEERSHGQKQVEQRAEEAKSRVSDALSEATNTFFKNVFEKQHNTAEEFSQDMLFNILAFPMEAINVYLTKTYDKNEKALLKEILTEMQKNKQHEDKGNVPGISQQEKHTAKMAKADANQQKLMTLMRQRKMAEAA